MTTLREAAQRVVDFAKWINDEQAVVPSHLMIALRTALAEPEPGGVCGRCGAWEPGCDLGANPKHAKRTEPVQEPENTRVAFESWLKADSTLPIDRDEHGYTDFTTTLMWHAWQAAKTNAPEGASGGGSCANARLGLAVADDTCAHEFAIDPSSGISLCVKCGLSEMVAKRRQRTETEQEPIDDWALIRKVGAELKEHGVESYTAVHFSRYRLLTAVRHFLSLAPGHLPDWLLQPAQAMREATEEIERSHGIGGEA